MMYHEFEVNGKTYKLRLSTKNIIGLEKRLGCNPVAVFGDGETIPSVTNMVNILHFALQDMQHGIGLDETYALFDAWLAEGHTMTDFIAEIISVYKVSGIIRADAKATISAEDDEKN